jgi:hypothetical protein
LGINGSNWLHSRTFGNDTLPQSRQHPSSVFIDFGWEQPAMASPDQSWQAIASATTVRNDLCLKNNSSAFKAEMH